MRNRMMVVVGVVVAVIMIPLIAAANPGIDIDPVYPDPEQPYDFGEVEVGASAEPLVVTISNSYILGLTIESVTLYQNGAAFTLIGAPLPETPIPSGGDLTFEVGFSPEVVGSATAELKIVWVNGENGESVTYLSGTGIPASGTPDIKDILAFFDDGVASGDIEGRGHRPGQKRAHLKIFQVRLVLAALFLDKGWVNGACKLLERCHAFSDGENGPRDLIEGPAVPELNIMIQDLMAELGCQ